MVVIEPVDMPIGLVVPVGIRVLGEGVASVGIGHLEALLGLRQAYISQQLMILRKKKIITSRREGKYIYYRLIKPEVLGIIEAAADIVGVQSDELGIPNHSNCECPKCGIDEEIVSTNQQILGQPS